MAQSGVGTVSYESIRVKNFLRVGDNSLWVANPNRIFTDSPQEPVLINCDRIKKEDAIFANDVVMAAGNENKVGIGVFFPHAKLHLMPGLGDGTKYWDTKKPVTKGLGSNKMVDLLINCGVGEKTPLASDSGFYMVRSCEKNLMQILERNPKYTVLFKSKNNMTIEVEKNDLSLQTLTKDIIANAQKNISIIATTGTVNISSRLNTRIRSVTSDIIIDAKQNINITSGNYITASSSSFQRYAAARYDYVLNGNNINVLAMHPHNYSATAPSFAVGIGTNTPKAHLQIKDKLTITDVPFSGKQGVWLMFNSYVYNNFSTYPLFHSLTSHPKHSAIRFYDKGHIGFYVDETGTPDFDFTIPTLTIYNSGNNKHHVLIGMDPDNSNVINALKYELEVCGSVRAKEYWAKPMTWCDYVFSSDYDLMSWEELWKYVGEHKHLPGVYSEKDIETMGMPLS